MSEGGNEGDKERKKKQREKSLVFAIVVLFLCADSSCVWGGSAFFSGRDTQMCFEYDFSYTAGINNRR